MTPYPTRILAVPLLLGLSCGGEVLDRAGVYQNTRTEPGRDWDLAVYAFCNDADPALDGECSGAEVYLERLEDTPTGQGYMYCYFAQSPGELLRADVWCQR